MNTKLGAHLTIEPLEARIAPAVFTVTTLNDSGTGSLRQALANADTAGGFNAIVFSLPAPPLHGENIITLTSGQLVTTGDVSILNPAGGLIINGNAASRVFDITGTTGVTTISGLSIVNGNRGTMNYSGGGIYSKVLPVL